MAPSIGQPDIICSSLPTLFLLPPRPHKKGGPYSQFLRIRRNCTLIESYEKHSQEMKKHYISRGYPENLLENSRIKALKANRKDLLTVIENKTDNPNPPPIKQTIKQHYPEKLGYTKVLT